MRSVKEFQKKTCSILDGSEFSRLSKFIEFFIVTIVVLNVLVIILESVPEINSVYSESFYVFELFSVGIFTLEYILRFWSYGVKYKKTEGYVALKKIHLLKIIKLIKSNTRIKIENRK